MIQDIDLDKAVRGNCPKCGGSKLKNNGYLKIEATSWNAEIWMTDGVITYKSDEIVSDDSIYEIGGRNDTLNPKFFEVDQFGWECQDCHHNFKTGEAKAAILGSSLEKLTQGML